MRRHLYIIATLLLISVQVFSEDPKYPVSLIPEELKGNNYAVIREKELHFEIVTGNSSKTKYRLVMTVLNAKGKNLEVQHLFYDKLQKVISVKGNIYSADGQLVRKIKSGEIRDQSAYDGFSLFSDNRAKFINFSHESYPFTIEFEYEIEHKFLYYIPPFYLYDDDEIGIEKTAYSISYPKGLAPRLKLNNISEPKTSTLDATRESVSWEFKNIKPAKFEALSPEFDRVVPNVIPAPVQFEYGGYAGRMDTWENFSKWQILLNNGRDVLPPETIQKIKDLTNNCATTEEKVKTVYEYVQNKTRYVSIQLGIGGYQPFEATVVDQLGYGDCKALSNYTVALLKQIDIKAHYSLVYAGESNRPIPKDFTIPNFNHIIVSVPDGKDTIWLECTSQSMPFGYLGSFTTDRYALMISDAGGQLVKTPSYTAEQNLQITRADVFVDINGDAKAKTETIYTGLQYDNDGLSRILNNQEEQKKWIERNTHIPTFDITAYSVSNVKTKIPKATVKIDLNLKRYASATGKRFFLTPNLMNKSSFVPEKLELRKTNIVRRMAYTDTDTIRYHLPESIYPEFMPSPVKVTSRFGEYEATFALDAGSLVYVRRLKMNKGEYPAESYNELIDFYKGISKADNTKMVFLSKT
jgi:transglutaminase-like putative cysteine protease